MAVVFQFLEGDQGAGVHGARGGQPKGKDGAANGKPAVMNERAPRKVSRTPPELLAQNSNCLLCTAAHMGNCTASPVAFDGVSSPPGHAVKARTGPAQWFAEFIATFGLIVTILAVSRFKAEAIPVAVGLYITAAYWFTASTSFANPAVTIARALTDSFSGIAPGDVPMFIVAQLAGALAGLAVMSWFFSPARESAPGVVSERVT